MNKTILAIAIAAASTVAFATDGGSTSVNSYSTAAVGGVVGSSVVGNGGGLAIMGSEASAWNVSTASSNEVCGPGVGVETSAATLGGASSTSWGLTVGNAGGVNAGVAYTTGSANANASDSGRNEWVNAGSSADMAAGAGTIVYGTGLSTQSSLAGAANVSGASANGNDGWTQFGIPGSAGGEMTAGTLGGSFSTSAGLSVGQAFGGTGAGAEQAGYANAGAGGDVFTLVGCGRWCVKTIDVGGAGVSGGASTGSMSETAVVGTGLAGTAAVGGGLVGGSASILTNGSSLAVTNATVYDVKGVATIGGNIGNAYDASEAVVGVGASASAGLY
jgi:hypothetical protein